MSIDRITREQSVEAAQTKVVIDKQFIGVVRAGKPSVENVEKFEARGEGFIEEFIRAQSGQTIYIRGNGDLIVEYNDKIKTNTGYDKLLEEDIVYVFTNFNGVFVEHEGV